MIILNNFHFQCLNRFETMIYIKSLLFWVLLKFDRYFNGLLISTFTKYAYIYARQVSINQYQYSADQDQWKNSTLFLIHIILRFNGFSTVNFNRNHDFHLSIAIPNLNDNVYLTWKRHKLNYTDLNHNL